MKKIILLFLSTIAIVLPMWAFAATASAQTGVAVSNGIAWTPNSSLPPGGQPDKPLSDYCTMGVVGTDQSGNKIGISAGHCVESVADGAPIYRWTPNNGPREQIGTLAYHSGGATSGVDYSVIKFNNDAVLSSNGPGARIDGIGPSNPVGIHCKDGQSTGVTCGQIITANTTPTRFFSYTTAGPGDSGGPAFQSNSIFGSNTKIVGLTRGIQGSGFEYIRFSAVLADIATNPNPAGDGFVVTNN